jgi:hypothetical protein
MIRRIHIEPDLINTVEQYLQHHNLANRDIEDGDYEKQKTGLIGELSVHKYLLGCYPDLSEKQNDFDGGYDINYNGRLIDVKTMGRRSDVRADYVNNFYLLQSSHNADTIVFCSYHMIDKVVEICGWLPKAVLPVRGIYYAAGTKRVRKDGSSFTFRQHNYEVENSNLDDIDILKNAP